MTKIDGKKLIKTSVTAFLTLFALILSLATYAWYSENEDVEGNGIFFKVDKQSGLGIYNLKIFKRFGADKAIDVSGSSNITLTEYDTIFTDKNINTAIIMRLELINLPYENGEYLPFHLRVKCKGADEYLSTFEGYSASTSEKFEDDWLLDGADLPDEYWQTDNTIDEYLSNIIGFHCALGDEELNAYTDPDDIYTHGKSYLNEFDEQTFLTVDGDNKRGIITFDFENYDSYIFSGSVIVYIAINYNDKLISVYSDQHDISTDSGEETGGDGESESIKFESDLTNCFIFMEGNY